jgi:hypothetical protein
MIRRRSGFGFAGDLGRVRHPIVLRHPTLILDRNRTLRSRIEIHDGCLDLVRMRISPRAQERVDGE